MFISTWVNFLKKQWATDIRPVFAAGKNRYPGYPTFMSRELASLMTWQQRGAADNDTMTWGWLGLCLQHLCYNIKPIPRWLYFSEEYDMISIWYWYTYTCSYNLGYKQYCLKKISAVLILITVTIFRLKMWISTNFARLNNTLYVLK